MTTASRGVKALIFGAINFVNEVNEKGEKQRRTSWKREHYLTSISISKKLTEDQEVIFGTPEIQERIKNEGAISMTDAEVEAVGGWKPFSEVNETTQPTVISFRHSDKELEFSDLEVATIKHFWKQVEDVSH